MSELKATPGPWFIGEYGKIQSAGMQLCDCVGVSGMALTSGEEAEANARLIAAAPELYEALGEMLQIDGSSGSQIEAALRKAREALAKARGES